MASAAAVKRVGPTTRMRRVEALREDRTCTPEAACNLATASPAPEVGQLALDAPIGAPSSSTSVHWVAAGSPPFASTVLITTSRTSSASVTVPSASGRPRWKRSSSRVAAIEAASAAFCCCRRSAKSRPPSMTSPAMARSPVRMIAKKISVAPRSPACRVRGGSGVCFIRRAHPGPGWSWCWAARCR